MKTFCFRTHVHSLTVLKASGVDKHLGSQLPLPLVGAVGGRAAARTVAHDGALGKVADVAALVESVLSCLQGGLQLLPQQQVMSGLLHLQRAVVHRKSLVRADNSIQTLTDAALVRCPNHIYTEGLNDLFVVQTDLLQ